MSILKKPYELSLWTDVYDADQYKFIEQRIGIIGTHSLTSQGRAQNVQLVQNVNGTNTLTFYVYFQYKDTITGETVVNPVCQYLTNERKLKLKYDDKWYDFIIKSVKKDSSKYTYEVSATDQYVNELSKNGYQVEFDAELNNNVGTVQELARVALRDTDWDVTGQNLVSNTNYAADGNYVGSGATEFIPDYATEALVRLTITNDNIVAYQLVSESSHKAPVAKDVTLSTGTIYAFYSCCTNKPSRFQFIYVPDGTEIIKDDERIIINANCQYYVDNVIYTSTNNGYSLTIPTWASFDSISNYRGKRYVFSADLKYNSILGQYATTYVKDGVQYLGVTKTESIVPKLIKDYVSNGSNFKSASGWRAVIQNGGVAADKGAVVQSTCKEGVGFDKTILDALIAGDTDLEDYTSYIEYNGTKNGLLMNTGFYDNRLTLSKSEEFINGNKFVLAMSYIASTDWKVEVVAANYNPATGEIIPGNQPFLTYTLSAGGNDEKATFTEAIATSIITNQSFTAKEIQNTRFCILFSPINGADSNCQLRIKSCEVYRAVQKDGKLVTPDTQTIEAITTTSYIYYKKADVEGADSLDEVMSSYISTNAPDIDGFVAPMSCEKRRSISIKQSNYFNIIQTLCEKFECWVEFEITRATNGRVLNKAVLFHNYIGKNNYAGFRYGVNLQSIQRTDDSKSIVTKLIVNSNSNEFGKNGYCAISRARSNETGEDIIYNFDHYINTGALLADDLQEILYNEDGAEGTDIDETASNINCRGYYLRLRRLNDKLNNITYTLNQQLSVYNSHEADYTTYSAGMQAAADELTSAIDKFTRYAGWPYTEASSHEGWLDNSTNNSYMVAIATAQQAYHQYKKLLEEAEKNYSETKVSYEKTNAELEKVKQQKDNLNRAFYALYSRFIQEGTWISEDYFDDEQYYLDALSTAYTSSVPSVSYSISVLELSQLEEYSDFVFALGDKTFVEDPEFFGYDEDSHPIRESVVLTEITYNLDAPDKNTIKVQNYKSQFQDLFKKITATVQSVKYTTGSYEKAAALAQSTAEKRGQFLQEAFDDAGMTIRNASEQTVTIDERGLTITDKLEPNNALRAVCGGIALTNDGGDTWTLGLTAKGVSAKLITSGILNTSEVNIMSGTDNTFRWDAFGLTAYDFTTNNDQILKLNTNKGVRFDHFGIYGFTGIDGSTWVPTSIAQWSISDGRLVVDSKSIRAHSTFELTKEGLYLSLGNMTQHYYYDSEGRLWPIVDDNIKEHSSSVLLGKTNDLLYNSWSADGLPYYDASNKDAADFVKIFSVGRDANNEQLVIYDDGTLTANKIKLTGSIEWTEASSPSKSVYGQQAYTVPKDNTQYSSFDDESSTTWHKVASAADQYYCHTDNGGATWQGPFGITGAAGEQGEPSYQVGFWASNGFVFHNLTEAMPTTLHAQVLAGATDITALIGNASSDKYKNWMINWYVQENNGTAVLVKDNDGNAYTQSDLMVVCEVTGIKSYQCVVVTDK